MRVHRWNEGIYFKAENKEEFRTLIAFLKLFEDLKYGPEAQLSEPSRIESIPKTNDD